MPKKTFQIKIESILGGQSEMRFQSRGRQYLYSYNIDPYLPAGDAVNSGNLEQFFRSSGLIRPRPVERFDGNNVAAGNIPIEFVPQPKTDEVFMVGSGGSVHTISTAYAVSETVGVVNARGAAYFDNYLYVSTPDDVARYGPLNGSPSLTSNYWTGTLSKTALEDTSYPTLAGGNLALPNHVLYRHVDSGRLYIADVVGNRGNIHFISTTKTTVEGDTDNGSTYQKLQLPFGYWPTALDQYGSDLAIALYEGSGSTTFKQRRAALAFWDTTSANYSKIVELPDPIITALKFDPVTGFLYVFSGTPGKYGTRVTRFISGYSFEQVGYIDASQPPFPGAVDVSGNRIIFGGTQYSLTNMSSRRPCVWAIGNGQTFRDNSIHCIMGSAGESADGELTALKDVSQEDLSREGPIIGVTDGASNRLDRSIYDAGGTRYDIESIFRSEIFRIGQPFKITRIRIPMLEPVDTGTNVQVRFFTDNQEDTHQQNTINTTNFPNSERNVLMKVANVRGEHSFLLELKPQAGGFQSTIGLPITIWGEIVDD